MLGADWIGDLQISLLTGDLDFLEYHLVSHLIQALDSLSAMEFMIPGRYWASNEMFLSMHHNHSVFARCERVGDTVPPFLFIYATAVVLSILRRTEMFNFPLANVWTARVAARSSRQLTFPEGGGTKDLWSISPRRWLPSPAVKHPSL